MTDLQFNVTMDSSAKCESKTERPALWQGRERNMQNILSAENIVKSYNDKPLLDDTSFYLHEGEKSE